MKLQDWSLSSLSYQLSSSNPLNGSTWPNKIPIPQYHPWHWYIYCTYIHLLDLYKISLMVNVGKYIIHGCFEYRCPTWDFLLNMFFVTICSEKKGFHFNPGKPAHRQGSLAAWRLVPVPFGGFPKMAVPQKTHPKCWSFLVGKPHGFCWGKPTNLRKHPHVNSPRNSSQVRFHFCRTLPESSVKLTSTLRSQRGFCCWGKKPLNTKHVTMIHHWVLERCLQKNLPFKKNGWFLKKPRGFFKLNLRCGLTKL